MAATTDKKELRVLLLEDTPTDAELAEHELRKAGIAFTVRRVDTRETFVAALEEFQPDIVLSDYKLPAFDGMSALQLVRRDHPDIPVIMVTGALPDFKAIELINAGAKDYVLKDRLARLGSAVQRVMAEEGELRARRDAERALRESEAKFRALVESTNDWIWEVSAQGVYTYTSPQVHSLLGYSVTEIIGKTPFDLMMPDEAARLKETFGTIMAEKKPFQLLENANLHKDGRIVFMETSGVPIFDERNIFMGYRGIDRDITERKRAAELIQRNNQLLETAFSSIHVMIAYLDKEFNFIKVNKTYAAADQRTPDFFPGKNHFDLYPSEENKAIFQQVVETGKPAIYYAKPFAYAEHPERGVSYWDWRAEPIKGTDGKVAGLLFSLLNVTEQTLAVQKIQAASEYARSLIEASLDPLVTINAEGKITDVNASTEKATGRIRAELIGTDFSDYFTEPDRAHAGYQQAFSQGYVTDYPLSLRHREGHVMDVLYNASVYRNEAGVVLGIFAAARDITARKLAEGKIKESEKKFRALTDTSPLAIYMSSGIEQQAEYLNPTFTRLFGYTLEEVPSVAEWWPRAYPDEQYRKQVSEAWQRKVEQAIKTNSGIEPMEVVVTCKDGSKKNISWGYISTGLQNWAFGLDLTERKRAEAALHRLNRTLRALSASNHALVHGENEQALLESMCRAATEGGFMMAWVGYAMQDEKKSVVPMATSGKGAGYVETLNITWDDQPLGRGPTGTAIRTGQTQIANDIGNAPGMAPWHETAAKYGYASSIALPLRKNGIIIGSLTIYAAEPGAFDAEQVALLEEMAEDLGFGLTALLTRDQRDRALEERQHYAEQLRASLEDALQAIAATVEMRDPYTAGHQRRVAHLAIAIAQEMGLREEQCHGIHLAGIVHDLGKIHIPAEVLSKPGRLSEIEFSFIKIHPQAGYDILKGIEFPWPIAQAVLQHHERLDGSGYPQGLAGDAIILEARILAVADVVEAMASHRPYRPSLGLEAALSEISTKRGIHFDPSVVDACLSLFSKRNYILPT